MAVNLQAMAEYGVEPTRAMRKAAAQPALTPSLIHAWARHGQSLGTVEDPPAWLASVLPHVDGPPPHVIGNGRNGGRQRGAHRRSGQQESTWTESELNKSRIESLAMCPIDVAYGCASGDEYLDLSDVEREQRAADIPRRVTQWAEKQTGEVAAAIRAVGGVYYGSGKFLSLNGQGEESAPPLGQKNPSFAEGL